MSKFKQQAIAMFLALVMSFQIMPLSAFAADVTEPETTAPETTVTESPEVKTTSEDQDVLEALENFRLQENPESGADYTVLILDSSSCMEGLEEVRNEAMQQLAKTLTVSEQPHYVAVVSTNETAEILCTFTDSEEELAAAIGKVKAADDLTVASALQKAEKLLTGLQDLDAENRNVVLCIAGMADSGDEAENAARKLKQQRIAVYTLGLLQNLSEEKMALTAEAIRKLGSMDCNFAVETAEEIEDVFEALTAALIPAEKTVEETVVETTEETTVETTEETVVETTEETTVETTEETEGGSDVQEALKACRLDKEQMHNYTVLIVDCAEGTEESLAQRKQDASMMIHTLLETSPYQYIAVIAVGKNSPICATFTKDENSLKNAIEKLEIQGSANMELALWKAQGMMEGIQNYPFHTRDIILLGGSLPADGVISENGLYSREDHDCFALANAAAETADRIRRDEVVLLTAGYYAGLSEADRSFSQKLLKDIAYGKHFAESSVENLIHHAVDLAYGEGAPISEKNKNNTEQEQDLQKMLQPRPDRPMLMSEGDKVRCTILVLDCSGSMEGEPFTAQKQAAIRFCNALEYESEKHPEVRNAIAVIEITNTSSVSCHLTENIQNAKRAINTMRIPPLFASTNYETALVSCYIVLDQVAKKYGDNVIRNIVFCSDGAPESGINRDRTEPFHSDDDEYYYYANYAVELCNDLKLAGVEIYTLGFLHKFIKHAPTDSAAEKKLVFTRELLKSMASPEKYQEVDDPEKLDFVFGEIAEDISLAPYDFQFPGQLVKGRDTHARCYYTDAYFQKDASIYNPSLATMSLCFELSSWTHTEGWPDDPEVTKSLKDPRNPWKNAYNLLTELGYTEFDVNDDWKQVPQDNTIGVLAAKKMIQYDKNGKFEIPLIAVAIRGGGYSSEWAGNFYMGAEGEHEGFGIAKNKVLDFIKEYCEKNNIQGDVKLWIVGYSRAGGVANMVGGTLVNDPARLGKSLNITPSNTYVYTFEAPQGALKAQLNKNYSNIHNIINPNDIVPKVAPAAWGFSRYYSGESQDKVYGTHPVDSLPVYGIDKYYNDRKERMLQFYSTFENSESEKYRLSDEVQCMKLIPKARYAADGRREYERVQTTMPTYMFLNETVEFLADDVFQSREHYATRYQKETMALIKELLAGVRDEEYLSHWEPFEQIEKILINVDDFYKTLNIPDLLESQFMLWLPGLSLAKAHDMAVAFRNYHKLIDADLGMGLLYRYRNSDAFAKIAMENFFSTHYPEITLSWLMSLDDNYGEVGEISHCQNNRLVHINCPVDLSVYDLDTGAIVASIIDDVVQTVSGNSVPAYINENSEKMLMLPADGNYSVKIRATGNGHMSCTIEDVDYFAGKQTRIDFYDSMEISKEDSLELKVPAMQEEESSGKIASGSNVNYELYDAKGNLVLPARQIRGQEAMNARYSVSLKRNNECGAVMGAGEFNMGAFAELIAVPAPRGEFLGWYEDGKLISDDEVYRFAVLENREFEARFEEISFYTIDFKIEGNGTIHNVQLTLPADSELELCTVEKENEQFIKWTAEKGRIENPESPSTVFVVPDEDCVITAHFTGDTSETDPSETKPSETDPSETEPAESKPEKAGIPVVLEQADQTGTIRPGAAVEIDGRQMTVDEDGEIRVMDSSCRILATYEYNAENKNAHETYPTGMHIWHLTEKDTDGDGKTDQLLARLVPELDGFLSYRGTSIRVGDKKNGIRFLTSIPEAGQKALLENKLLTGDLAGYRLKKMGTIYKWAKTGTELLADVNAVSYCYGGKAGHNFQTFSRKDGKVTFTGMLVDLGKDADVLKDDIISRPFMVFAKGDQEITIYGGAVQRSIYYVAQQNRDYWNPGTVYDNYVENIIKTAESK